MGGTGGAARGDQKENVRRSVGGLSRDIDRLDDELLNARVDPFLLKRTIENSRTRVGGGASRSPVRGAQTRRLSDKYNSVAQYGEQEQELRSSQADRTMASRLEGPGGSVGVSPLQGTKIVIQNLQTSVTQEDILELFGDIGALRRAKLVNPGHAEVTFVNKGDAVKAVEIYHNRQLDGSLWSASLLV